MTVVYRQEFMDETDHQLYAFSGEMKMRRVLFQTSALCLLLSISAFGQDQSLQGKMFISGYGGYTLGVGDPWGAQRIDTTIMGIPYDLKWTLDPSIAFGGMFHYGVGDRLMLGGELGFQMYDNEAHEVVAGNTMPGESTTETKLNILFNGLYALNYVEGEKGLFITIGGGIYGGLGGVLDLEKALEDIAADKEPDENGVAFGVNGGLLYTRMVSESFGLFVMPRFHYVFSDPNAKMVQIVGGIHIPLGN